LQHLEGSGPAHFYIYWNEFVDAEGERKLTDDHNLFFKKKAKRFLTKHLLNLEIQNIALPHLKQRVVLSREEIKMARSAQGITRAAFLDLLQNLKSHLNERTLGAALDAGMLSRTSGGLAFPTIVAGGKNACTLHYRKKDEPLRKGDLVLLDFGCRSGAICSDLSRTLPISGKFNPLQKLLYTLVLDTMVFHQQQVRPGVTLREISKKSWAYLEAQLKERFLALGGKAERSYKQKPHGISHLIGGIVHEGDPHRCYYDWPLEPGMLLSNEPGLYGKFTLRIDGRLYCEDIGIRIEDDLVVTSTGCLNLSLAIPKSVEALEELMNK
jgi:Xaa-Pro aminopeptidase